jgi:hypothetical protein
MGVFGKRAPSHLIPVSPDNAASNDWVVLLEAGTIVGPSPDRLRVAKSTLEKKIVKRYNFFLKATHFLDVEGYDPRIHVVYFLNFTNMTQIKSSYLCKERRSGN